MLADDSLEEVVDWDNPTITAWNTLVSDYTFSLMADFFRENFILITQLRPKNPLQIIKIAYQQYLPYSKLGFFERFGFLSTVLPFEVPAVALARSYHVRVLAPPGLRLTSVELFQVEPPVEPEAATTEHVEPEAATTEHVEPEAATTKHPFLKHAVAKAAAAKAATARFFAQVGRRLSALRSWAKSQQGASVVEPTTLPIPYRRRLSITSAQIYTSPQHDAGQGRTFIDVLKPSSPSYWIAVGMRVPIMGYLRALWLSSLATGIVLCMARLAFSWIVKDVNSGGGAEALVALILVAPSLLTAYLVRPTEHAIASRMLGIVRFDVAAIGSLGYFAAAIIVLQRYVPYVSAVLTTVLILVGTGAGFVTVIIWLTWRDAVAANVMTAESEYNRATKVS